MIYQLPNMPFEDYELPQGVHERPRSWFQELDIVAEFQVQVRTLRDTPKCIRGSYSRILGAVVKALAAEYARRRRDPVKLESLWKEFLMLPRLLLHPVGKWGRDGREVLGGHRLWWRIHLLWRSSQTAG